MPSAPAPVTIEEVKNRLDDLPKVLVVFAAVGIAIAIVALNAGDLIDWPAMITRIIATLIAAVLIAVIAQQGQIAVGV